MKPSEVLIEAKKNLARNNREVKQGKKQRFICYAIGYEDTLEKILVKKLIRKRLGFSSTLGRWLAVTKNIKVNFNEPKVVDRLQLTRHAWVDDLIKEFQSKGQ